MVYKLFSLIMTILLRRTENTLTNVIALLGQEVHFRCFTLGLILKHNNPFLLLKI